MFHHKRNKDLDFDGHGERIEKLQAAKVGHGATASFDAYKRRTLCCGGGVNDVRAVHPVPEALTAPARAVHPVHPVSADR